MKEQLKERQKNGRSVNPTLVSHHCHLFRGLSTVHLKSVTVRAREKHMVASILGKDPCDHTQLTLTPKGSMMMLI